MAGTPFIKFDRDTPWRWGLTRLGHELHVPPITAHLWLLYAVNRIELNRCRATSSDGMA